MDFLHRAGACAAVSITLATAAVQAESPLVIASPATDWQMRRLMEPTPSQLAAESKGQVFIYDSLEINQVESAMDKNFDRIEHMMFIRIHHPAETEGVEALVEDDDC